MVGEDRDELMNHDEYILKWEKYISVSVCRAFDIYYNINYCFNDKTIIYGYYKKYQQFKQ